MSKNSTSIRKNSACSFWERHAEYFFSLSNDMRDVDNMLNDDDNLQNDKQMSGEGGDEKGRDEEWFLCKCFFIIFYFIL